MSLSNKTECSVRWSGSSGIYRTFSSKENWCSSSWPPMLPATLPFASQWSQAQQFYNGHLLCPHCIPCSGSPRQLTQHMYFLSFFFPKAIWALRWAFCLSVILYFCERRALRRIGNDLTATQGTMVRSIKQKAIYTKLSLCSFCPRLDSKYWYVSVCAAWTQCRTCVSCINNDVYNLSRVGFADQMLMLLLSVQ